jgi:hypothetical protein
VPLQPFDGTLKKRLILYLRNKNTSLLLMSHSTEPTPSPPHETFEFCRRLRLLLTLALLGKFAFEVLIAILR